MKRLFALAVAMLPLVVLVALPAQATGRGPAVLIETVPPGQDNTFFDVDSLWHPQVAQTLTVNSSMTWTSLRLRTFQLKVATSRDVFRRILDGGYDEKWFTSYLKGKSVTARTTLEVWRYNGQGDIPEFIDLASDFTQVHVSEGRRTIPIGRSVSFPLPGGLGISPGRYAIVLGFRFDDPLVFNLRFAGQENGSNTKGGYDHDHPVSAECAAYKKTKDSNPGGQAYRPQPVSPPDPAKMTVPFTTVFEAVDTKVLMPCNMDGVYDPNRQIWNPGDLQVTILGRR